ncbi:hypothetical protein BT67DRAFT_308728 [Trichocladium antarcticum]|uniref:Uncharacterized protein n=1 Tax=Trichocladium antarcticum TaxID=1450529 RepID=A0AAN6ZCL1_9PEZI|nr:hypothetical protein BT67DRAFT_308728 [Trichocladium antarcticum]
MGLTEDPAAHSLMVVDSVSSLECITVAGSGLQNTAGYSDWDVTDTIEDTGCEQSFESPWSPSTGSTNHGFSLRGGFDRYRPPSARQEDDSSDEERDVTSLNNLDYQDLRRYAAKDTREDDGESVSSDWDSYGTLPFTMDDYNKAVAHLEGSADWNADQRKLHQLIYMRGLHPLVPSWWRLSFRMWGVTQPHLDDVFTPKHSKKRVAIHSFGNECAATKALESLFYLSQTVTDYEDIGNEAKISSVIVRGINKYITWALKDAGIDRSKTEPTILVRQFSPDFRGDDDDIDTNDSDFASSGNEGRGRMTGTSASAGRDQARFTRALKKDLEGKFHRLGARWRAQLWDEDGQRWLAEPPTLYALSVVQHVVMLTSHDSSSAKNPLVVLDQTKLNERGLWLWNALSIALPVNMARDGLCKLWHTGVVKRLDSHPVGQDPDR